MMTLEQYKQSLRLRHKALREDIRFDMVMLNKNVNMVTDERIAEQHLIRKIAKINGWVEEIEN